MRWVAYHTAVAVSGSSSNFFPEILVQRAVISHSERAVKTIAVSHHVLLRKHDVGVVLQMRDVLAVSKSICTYVEGRGYCPLLLNSEVGFLRQDFGILRFVLGIFG